MSGVLESAVVVSQQRTGRDDEYVKSTIEKMQKSRRLHIVYEGDLKAKLYKESLEHKMACDVRIFKSPALLTVETRRGS